MRHRGLILIAFALLLPLHAQSASYVSDRLTAPLRGLNAVDGPIVRQIIAGAPVTILEKDNPLYKVKTEDGSVGYMDPAQISGEKPLQVLYIEMTDRYNKAQEQLKAAQSGGGRDDNKTLADLRSELKSALDRLTDTERAAQVSASQLSAAQAKNSSLELELAELKRQLAARPSATDARSSGDRDSGASTPATSNEFFPAGTIPPSSVARSSFSMTWLIVAAGVALTIGLALGAFTFDYYVRQRHGGFRTY